MKPWMKALTWLGLGFGFGFFVGQQCGRKNNSAEDAQESLDRVHKDYEKLVLDYAIVTDEYCELMDLCNEHGLAGEAIKASNRAKARYENANEALKEYAGDISSVEGINEILHEPATDDEPEMPSEEDIMIDPDIPQLHPQHLVPEIIGEEEFNANIWNYDIENLIFYEMDEVLYNETTQSIIENPDDVVGIGTLFEFGGNPNNPVEIIYVKNDTFGTLFRIDHLDAAFCDAVDGTCGPEDDNPEEDDFWNDGDG